MNAEASFTRRIVDAAHSLAAWFESPAGMRLKRWASFALSALVLLILVRAIFDIGWRQIIDVLPISPLFWLLFAGSYLLQPVMDFVIYARWWPLGWHDMAVFLKKRVMNEALFSYSGETYLLVRATELLGIAFDPKAPPKRLLGRGDTPGLDPRSSPFAAVKDVNIMSGLAGNLTTLLMLIIALSIGRDSVLSKTLDPSLVRNIVIGFSFLIPLSLSIIIFRGRVMSIPTRENMPVFWLHLFRVLVAHLLIVGSWIVALPEVAIATWILLGALRMVIGRMPLPNKELLFAALAVSLTGEASVQVAALMAAQGALHLVFHGLSWLAGSALEAAAPAGAAPSKDG